MEINENLVSYHFQRKLAGISTEEIEHSLRQNVLIEEERELILHLILEKEAHYLRTVKRRNQKKWLAVSLTIALLLLLWTYLGFHWSTANTFQLATSLLFTALAFLSLRLFRVKVYRRR